MQETQLVQLLASLSKPDRRELRKFARSPFFNLRDDLARLIEHLAERIDRPELLEKRAVFAAVQPDKIFDDLHWRHLLSMAFQLVKKFLAVQNWLADPQNLQLELCEVLQKRELNPLLEREIARSRLDLEAAPHRDAAHFFKKYRLEQVDWNLSHRQQRFGRGNLQEMGAAFSAFVAVNSLRHRSAILTQNVVAGADRRDAAPPPELPFAVAAKMAVEQGEFAETPAAQLYFHSCRMLENMDSDADFRAMTRLLETHWQVLQQPEAKDLYTVAINFCIRKINAGQREFVREVFDLYRSGLERRVLLENNFLSKYTYNNILLTALALGEWSWSLDFLENWKTLLPPRDRENSHRYNLAIYWFRRPDFDRVMQILQNVEFRDPLYNLDARRMLLRIFFEKDAWQAAEPALESFKMYLRRHRSIGYHRDLNLNFLKFLQQILRLRRDGFGSAARIRSAVETVEMVAERGWLLTQIF